MVGSGGGGGGAGCFVGILSKLRMTNAEYSRCLFSQGKKKKGGRCDYERCVEPVLGVVLEPRLFTQEMRYMNIYVCALPLVCVCVCVRVRDKGGIARVDVTQAQL